MTSRSLESEVASYILGRIRVILESGYYYYFAAYLLQNNFKASAHAFLKECDALPSKTFIVCMLQVTHY